MGARRGLSEGARPRSPIAAVVALVVGLLCVVVIGAAFMQFARDVVEVRNGAAANRGEGVPGTYVAEQAVGGARTLRTYRGTFTPNADGPVVTGVDFRGGYAPVGEPLAAVRVGDDPTPRVVYMPGGSYLVRAALHSAQWLLACAVSVLVLRFVRPFLTRARGARPRVTRAVGPGAPEGQDASR